MYIFYFCLSAQGGDRQVYKLLSGAYTVCTQLGPKTENTKYTLFGENNYEL